MHAQFFATWFPQSLPKWILAFARMTKKGSGMTANSAGMTEKGCQSDFTFKPLHPDANQDPVIKTTKHPLSSFSLLYYVNKLCLLIMLVGLGVILSPNSAYAACSNPAGVEGEQVFNSTYRNMQFCNGTDWIAMGYVRGPGIACAAPWGGTIDSGAEVIAFENATVPFGNVCNGETRICDEGSLSGSFTNQTCTVATSSSCNLPWSGSINDGQSVTAYLSYNSSCSTTETRTCNNGVLSGSYQYNSCAPGALANGVYGWASGPNTAQIGGASESAGVPTPVVMPSGVAYFTDMTADGNIHCGFGNNGVLYCMGMHAGNGTSTFQANHDAVDLPSGVTSYQSVSLGQQGGCAEGNNNRVYCWGLNGSTGVSKFGNGDTTPRIYSPVLIPFPPGVTRFVQHDSAGWTNHYLGNDGNIYSSGAGSQGMLGNSTNTDTTTLVQVTKPSGVSSWTDIYAGSWHMCAKANTGSIYCWGMNDSGSGGQLGNGNTVNQNRPVPVLMPSGVSTFTTIALNTSSSCAIAPNEELYCWGHADTTKTRPTLIPRPAGVTGWADAEGGNSYMTLLTNDGRVFNFRPYNSTFTAYPSLTNVTDISAGTFTIHAVQGP